MKTYENCPKGCESTSYLYDNLEERSCLKCGTVWNRFDNEIVVDRTPEESTNKETLK